MSLWWVKKDQLDNAQIDLIENLPLSESFLILGPPGSGKTNVLLRRAQFIRGQNMPNVLVLTFTRSLTEFVKTGCMDEQGREIFPRNCVTTIESWLRSLYELHGAKLPASTDNLTEWKRRLARGAVDFVNAGRLPRYDTLFVDEAQDLLQEEVDLVAALSKVHFFVGDDRQKIHPEAEGLMAVRQIVMPDHERTLRFHYRVARQLCRAADRVLLPHSSESLESDVPLHWSYSCTSYYSANGANKGGSIEASSDTTKAANQSVRGFNCAGRPNWPSCGTKDGPRRGACSALARSAARR